MSAANFWIFADVGKTLEAFAVFSLFIFIPGYVAGWTADLFEFRRGSLLRQATLSVPLSIAVVPILMYLPWRSVSIHAVWILMGMMWLAFVVIVGLQWREGRLRWQSRAMWLVGV